MKFIFIYHVEQVVDENVVINFFVKVIINMLQLLII